MEQLNRLDDSRFEIVKEPVLADPVIETYSIDELKARELAIVKSINDFTEEKKAELETVRVLILKAEGLGLKTAEVLQTEELVTEENLLAEVLVEAVALEEELAKEALIG